MDTIFYYLGCVCMRTYIYVYIYIYIYIFICVSLCVCVCMCILCVFMHSRVCVSSIICLFIHYLHFIPFCFLFCFLNTIRSEQCYSILSIAMAAYVVLSLNG